LISTAELLIERAAPRTTPPCPSPAHHGANLISNNQHDGYLDHSYQGNSKSYATQALPSKFQPHCKKQEDKAKIGKQAHGVRILNGEPWQQEGADNEAC
jgi:hypothetical protein